MPSPPESRRDKVIAHVVAAAVVVPDETGGVCVAGDACAVDIQGWQVEVCGLPVGRDAEPDWVSAVQGDAYDVFVVCGCAFICVAFCLSDGFAGGEGVEQECVEKGFDGNSHLRVALRRQGQKE